MLLKGVVEEDFVNYKKPSMFIIFPSCSFKCEKECGISGLCQNSSIALQNNIDVDYETIVSKYLKNDITKAIVMGGLEPFDSLPELHHLVKEFRKHTDDPIIIYTGYTEKEFEQYPYILSYLSRFKNIIVKFGRYIPNDTPHYDPLLGINLVSSNQYAKNIGVIE